MKVIVAARVDVEVALSEVPGQTRAVFLSYHRENPKVWAEFERFALQAAERGRHIGAKAIGERVRWESEIVRGEEWKVNNNFLAYYARIFAAKYPEHAHMFEFRTVHGLREVA